MLHLPCGSFATLSMENMWCSFKCFFPKTAQCLYPKLTFSFHFFRILELLFTAFCIKNMYTNIYKRTLSCGHVTSCPSAQCESLRSGHRSVSKPVYLHVLGGQVFFPVFVFYPSAIHLWLEGDCRGTVGRACGRAA